jgi:hypothetical protein
VLFTKAAKNAKQKRILITFWCADEQLQLSYQLVRTRRKTLGLTIERDGKIVIRAPEDSTQKVIDDFFESKKFWIYKKLAEKRMIEEDLPLKEYVNGEGFLYLGKSYRLQLVENGVPLRLSHGFFQLNKK